MEEKSLNEKESLELITRMIQNTQNRLVGNEGMPFLIWGYITVAVTIAVGLVLTLTQNYLWNGLWFAIPVLGWILTILFNKKTETGIKTYVDKVVWYVWIVIGIGCVLSAALCILNNLQMHILFIELLLVGSGAAITGLVIEFKAVTIGGFIGMALAFLMLFIAFEKMVVILAVFVAAFIVMMIIPGHILNHAARQQVKKAR